MSLLYAFLACTCALIVGRCQGDLGKAFTAQVHVVYLYTWGWYRWFRHPIYMFAMLEYVFLVAVKWPRWCWVPVVLLGPLQLWRARRENEALETAFPEAYKKYKEEVLF